jgi:pyruvate dehydrogenase E2 component (dihydrolipoamide acetyltransferase)
MAVEFIMPKQGQSVENCILTEWYKNVGEKISKGELLFAYETDKAAFEEEATTDGIILAQFYKAGDEVPVLATVGMIGSEGEELTASIIENPKNRELFEPEIRTEGANKGNNIQADSGKVFISPRARSLAKMKGILFDGIDGTGPLGRVVERDIIDEVKKGNGLTPLVMESGKLDDPKIARNDFPEISSAKYSDIKVSNVRKIIARAMHRSLQNSAQLTHHMSANASRMLQVRKEVKSRSKNGYGYNITLNDMVCYSVVQALKKFPDANAHFLDDKIRRYNKVNLGVAVDTERGLMVPTLVDADDLSLPGLSSRLKYLADCSRTGSISPDLILPESASFTVSNLGNYGVEFFTPIINLPQVAILGVNAVSLRPTEMDDGIFGFLPFIGLSLTYDHRAIDGGPATLFLREIKNEIEKLSINLL